MADIAFFSLVFYMFSAGSSVAINNARPSQAEIYAKAGVDLQDGKLPAPGDAAAKDKVVSHSSLLRVPQFCPGGLATVSLSGVLAPPPL